MDNCGLIFFFNWHYFFSKRGGFLVPEACRPGHLIFIHVVINKGTLGLGKILFQVGQPCWDLTSAILWTFSWRCSSGLSSRICADSTTTAPLLRCSPHPATASADCSRSFTQPQACLGNSSTSPLFPMPDNHSLGNLVGVHTGSCIFSTGVYKYFRLRDRQ